MLKNLKEKLKKEITKKKIATIAIFAVAVIATIIAIVVNQTNEQSSKRKKIIADGELACAMTYDQFADGDDAIEGTDNVKFSAFFLRDVNGDGYAEKIKGTCKQIGKEDTLYMEVNVQTDGILKNAKIEVDGKNFYLATTAPKDNELKDNYVGTNIKKLEFNDMANGTQKLITGVVRSGDYSYTSSKASAIGSNINNLSRNDNKIIFTGTYVGSDGNEVQINKEINLQTDWYGTTSAGISTSNYSSSSTYYDIQDRQNEEDGTLTLTAGISTYENNYQLNIKKNYVEGTIPQLNGYDPISVTAETSTDSFNYDETTRKFTLTREAQVDETGNITKSISRDNINTLKIVYPLEAYKSLDSTVVTIEIPVMTYYEGYNNTNREFTNPYKSNEAKGILTYTFRGPQEYQTNMNIRVGEYMYNPTYRYVVSKKKPIRIYNEISSEEKDDNYIVSWYISKGTNESSDGLIMKERKDGEATVADSFVKVDATRDSMESLTTNIGIGFGNADKFLGDDGYIKVYDDETDELLVTFTKDDWGKYTRTSPYKFSMPVKHIRVETSQTQDSQYFYVYSQKQLDDEYITTNYTREQFDELKYIESHLNVYAGTKLLGTLTHMANYEAPYSIAELTLSKNTLSTQLTEKNEILTIKATANESANQVGWTNGSFLIKLPADIIATDINTVEINNSSISLTSYEYIENDNGKFIKINTKNTSNTAQTFEVRIDTNITPDPRIATTTEKFELWASNEEGVDYYYNSADIYDVNDNLNLDEKVHKSTTSVSLIAPNSLLTNQTASGFDKSGTQIVSPQIADVKPQLATVSQDTPEKTVKIGAQIKNNYSSVITDVVMLGKIPFEGNTYVLSGEDLGSEFTTKMTNKGIEVPEELKNKVVVYYSENETPDKDLTNESNGWKTAENITNWDNVKTYLIDFQDVEIASGAEYTFYYTIQVPNGLDYNKKTFSHHGVYFSLKTPEGKYKTQTEPNKLGIRIAEKYNLELQKYQTGKTNLVPGATYKVTKEATDTDDEEVATAVTNAEGILELQNLYAKRTYAIEEIKVPEDYELNTDVIKIIGTVQADGSLQISKTQGTTREDIEVTKEEDEPYKVIVKVEDEAKVKLKLTKLEKDTATPVRGIRYKLTGTGLPENGKNVTTNTNGEITVKGLKVGEEYTLEETKAEGYYLASQIKFTVTNTEGTYTINVSEGTVKESAISEEENIPTANIKVEDEKIPTYNLEISKIQRITSTAVTEDELRAKAEQALSSTDTVYLSGAKFRLYKGTKELGSYITDENGKITLNDLYQYIEGKDEEATYTLKETLSPDGYSKVKDITFKVDGSTGELKFINTEGKDESYTVEGNTVKLLVEDNPSFKLIKKDSETSELLANIKFAIYNIDNDTTTPAKNSKGETIGTKETINGKEYYTVTTDSKGEITADLPEGMYKAVEVEAPEKYDISDSTYYFGIGTSREGKEGITATWAQGIGGTANDGINSVAATSDGGYVVGGYFDSSSITLDNGKVLTNNGNSNGMIIKYNNNKEIEWAKSVGGNSYDKITSVVATNDGGYIVVGKFTSSNINLENDLKLTNSGNGSTDGMIIKFNIKGEIEWAQVIGGESDDYINSIAETSDGGYVVGGQFASRSIILDSEKKVKLTNKGEYFYHDGMIIKYDLNGKAEWAKEIGGSSSDFINSVVETSDGGYIGVGYFISDSIELGNGLNLTNNGNGDGMIIKVNVKGEIEWAQAIGGKGYDYINSIAETTDGGYIVGGYYNSEEIQINNEVKLIKEYNSLNNIMLLYINRYGDVTSAITKEGNSYIDKIDIITDSNNEIYIGDGSYLTVCSPSGETIFKQYIGNYGTHIRSISITDKKILCVGDFGNKIEGIGNGIKVNSKGNADGVILEYIRKYKSNPQIEHNTRFDVRDQMMNSIATVYFKDQSYIVGSQDQDRNGIGCTLRKYSKTNNIEYEKKIYNIYIQSAIATKDNGYIVAGYFNQSSIELENGIKITKKGSRDAIIIKYSFEGNIEWAKSIGGGTDTLINSIDETINGEYILGGYFYGSLELENGQNLISKGNADGIIIKCSSSGEIDWAQGIGGTALDEINSVAATFDGGYIVGGYFNSSSIDLGNGVSLTNKGSTGYSDGMIIKYNSSDEVEWSNVIGGDSIDTINSVIELTDGSYVVGGIYFSENIDLGNSILAKANPYHYQNGIIIKYNCLGIPESIDSIVGRNRTEINSMVQCDDGGYVVVGRSSENRYAIDQFTKLWGEGMIAIKYDNGGDIEWVINGSSSKNNSRTNFTSICKNDNEEYIIGGSFSDSQININGYIIEGEENKLNGFIIKVSNKIGVPEVQELEVDNKRKEFKITTDVKEIDSIKGGSISGEDENPYEKVKYGDTSTNEIKMIPDENYEIIGITVNGEDYNFTANEDGSYTMPVFTNMTENKHIVVTYSLKDNKITLNKVDKNTKEKLQGAIFKLDQIEERSEPDNSEIIGELTDNGQEYTQVIPGDEVTGKLGELTNNGTYYFVQNEDGTYTPTNSKTYQTANGGTAGISSSTANSYIPIDLTNLTGQYAVVVNANCSSESADKGYVEITENTTAVSSNQTGKLVYIYGTQSAKDYTSSILEGGKTYYLHMGYYKDSSVDIGTDQIVINSIKLYNATTNSVTYNFINNNGKYESTNTGKDDTVSNSYIPIDLTNYTGKYNLTVNAEISSEGSDYGYVTITENTTRPSYNSSTGRFVYIYGTQSAKDYTTVLQGGKMYYLHLGYYKNASDSSGDDKFTVNSINVTLNDSELYHTTIETNSDGQAITQIPFGKYSITETKAPDGYWLNETPTIVEFRSTDGVVHEFTIEDEEKAKLTVHHYIKGTTTKLAEDEKSEAHIGDSYTTKPKLDLDKYELETDETGKLVLPENATGTYAQTPTEVTYYYVEKKIPLTVHHYIEGTSTQVPLKTGGTAGDQVDSGLEGESYTTSAISDENLSDEYELVEVPTNANGTYAGDEVIVTYYYKKVSREVNLVKYQQDGITPLQGAKFNVKKKIKGINIDSIENNGTYYFENKDGKYVSNNKNKSSTTANSYIKIDMTNASEDATVTVNAEISSESGYDIGYATITETETVPSYSSTIGRFIYISGTQSAKDYIANLEKGKIYYLHFGYKKDGSRDTGTDTFTINSIKINNIDDSKNYTTNEQGKIQTNLEAGTYEITETEAPEGYKLPENPTTEITITKETTTEDINITNDKKTGTVTVHHYIEGTTNQVPMSDGSLAEDETKTGYVGDMYATTAKEGISASYELVSEPENSSGNYIEGNIEVIYYYKAIPASVLVHHYLEGTTTKLADDVTFDGIVGDNYTTGVAPVDSKYEVVAIPANANGKMTREQIVVIYYYRVKDTSILVHHYKEGTSESLSDDVTINGKVDDEYTTSKADDIPSKYELVAEPDNKNGIMTVEQTVVTYYYRLKETGVDVHYYKEGTTEKVSEDAEIKGRVDDNYITTPATDVESKYELVETPTNATGTMTEDRITVIYYYRLKDKSVLVHHYLEGTTTKLADDVTIKGKVDDTYKTVENTDLLAGKYELVAEPDNKNGTMTEEQIVVIYYYRAKDTSVLVHHYKEGTAEKVSEDVTINGKIDDDYTTTNAEDLPEYYELVAEPDNKNGTMTEEQIVVTYYYKLKKYPYTVNYLEKGTDNVLNEQKQGEALTYGSTVKSSDEKINIKGYNFDSYDKDVLTIGTTNNVINIYYTKKTDLSYTVNYLEKETNNVLHEQKVQDGMTFDATVNSADEIIDIDGYNYDSVDKDKLVIGTGENVINIYYTKRTDLSYTVNYLEKDTNKVLHDQKTQDGMTFESVVTSADEVIDIDGYNYDSVDKETLTITTEENIINIYYTKRNDLSYKVNYLEKDTNQVLHNQKVQDGMTFESVVNSSDEVINIYGYNYDSVDKDKLIIGTGENVINIYYTKKDAKVTVHYYEEGTTNKVSEDVKIPGKVFDKYETESATDIPSKYELVAEPENKNGTMTEDEITVIYYYRKKATQVIVHYYEENTTKKLSEDVTINGKVDDSYTTVSADDIPIKYELVATPSNANGSMTEKTIEVIYYYKVKDAIVNVRYLEKGTDKVLADPDKLDGKVDDLYETSAKDIEAYQLVEHTGNEKGKFEVEPITITYYYLYKTKATVQYIDKTTGQILEQSTTKGLEGDDFVTESKDFENYVLVEEPAEKTVKMTKEEQILKYYYIHVSGGVIEKHIDVISGQILANKTYEGNEGDAYDIPSRTFEGYDLVEDRLPSNAKGTMKVEPVEVIYYYIYRSKVTAEYIDKNTGEKLTEDVTQNGHEGDNYITERKTFDDYKLVEVPSNADGSMTKEDITVTYYYVHTSGGVIVNHIDIKTGKQLLDETKEEGYEGDPYETHEENIPEYDLVKEKYPENATGKMTIEPTRVTYYYIKKTEVNIKYVDKETGEEIDEPTNIPGHEGDDYTTEPKDVPGYDLIEEPENKDGTMTADPIDVIYYYKRPVKVIVNYYDIDTKEKLADEIEITGHQNDDYTTEQKDIKYYEIARIPENKEGKMIVTVTKDENGKEIVDDTTYVNYYYRKLIFNLRVDKTIASVIVNGQETIINGSLGKVEVHKKNISNANVKVVYKIKVTNDSELTGKANVVENIPSGMTMIADNNPGWTINETTASVETDEIKPGESREYQVVLGWQNGDNNIGTKENIASIITENEAGFEEKDKSDNESKADFIVAVGTGEIPYVAIAGSILLIMISLTAGIYVIKKKRQ